MIARVLIVLLVMGVNHARAMPAADFFQMPDILAAQLSPNGARIAAIVGVDAEQALVVINADTGRRTTLLRVTEFTENDASLIATRWLDDKTVAALFSEVRAGTRNLLDTRRNRYVLIVPLPEIEGQEAQILSVRTSGTLVDPLPDAPGEFLYAKSGPLSRVYRLSVAGLAPYGSKLSKLTKIDGGQFVRSNEVAQVEGYAIDWFVNVDGVPQAVLNFSEQGLVLNALDPDQQSRELKRWDAETLASEEDDAPQLLPVAAAQGKDRFYCLDVNAQEQRSVYLMDYATNETTLVYTSSEDTIVDLIRSPVTQALVGVSVLRDGQLRHVYLDPANSASLAQTDATTLRMDIGQSRSGDRTLSYVESHSQPGQFWLAGGGGAPRLVGGNEPHLDNRLHAQLVEGRVDVEGLSIPYLLTLPKSATPAPLIVMPHGGPVDVFDTRYFDATTQFLAANGYAVLRVNFRGSGGYTTSFMEAGKREYGNLMLKDIHTAALEVLSRPDIDEARVAVFGASYGGYAATMLAIEHPQVYRCAVTVAGVMDIGLFMNRTDRMERQRAWARDYIGDPETDYDRLKAISPIGRVATLQLPLLVMHGARDDVVDIEHAYRLKRLLDKYGKNYTWHVFEEGTHGFTGIEETVLLHDKVLSFVDSHLRAARR